MGHAVEVDGENKVARAPAQGVQPLAERAETSSRSRIRRHPERSVAERAEAILKAGRVAHVAFAIQGQPYVIPFGYYYEDGAVYLHGAPASRTLKQLAAGTAVAIEVTLLDGLVASRDARNHSMNYRSVVVYGTAESITDLDEKRAIFERMTGRFFSQRQADRDYAAASLKDLRSVQLLAVRIDELSAKSRTGGPKGPRDEDESASGTAYVVELPGLDA
jgi:nitroimidazol reductase NimA-like FMN-containing flavoprotein (pyridoxamine 5'-phosphate oxidase superfamily)